MDLKVFTLNEKKSLEPSTAAAFEGLRKGGGPFWVNIAKPDQAQLKEFMAPLELHPLILDACLDPAAGYRIALYERSLFIKLPVQPAWDDPEPSFISIICLPEAIITIHNRIVPALESIVAEFSTVLRFHTPNTSAVLYQILDRLIDEDMAFVLKARLEITSLEETIDREDKSVHMDKMLDFKRQAARLLITFEDQRHCVTALQTIESEVFDSTGLREYFHDTLANLEYAARSVGQQQAHLSELHQHYLLTLQDRTNNRLRLLTIISAVFMPLTLIVGIYGMNFRYMPELKWRYGYPIVIVVMCVLAGGLLWVFRRRGWFG